MAAVVNLIWVDREAIYFSREGWTGIREECPSGKSLAGQERRKRCSAALSYPSPRAPCVPVGWVEHFAKPIVICEEDRFREDAQPILHAGLRGAPARRSVRGWQEFAQPLGDAHQPVFLRRWKVMGFAKAFIPSNMLN